MTILIGLTGWGDHVDIYDQEHTTRNKLESYAAHFPVVELDSAFYGIIDHSQYEKWSNQTPSNFSFVVKAYQAFTGHDRQKYTRKEMKELFSLYQKQISPLVKEGKLQNILFQFPPWFDVNQDNIRRLKFIREQFKDYPIAIEFRNRSWYDEHIKEHTLQYLQDDRWIHTICDEPQAGKSSVPIVPEVTNVEQSLIRFHGRNIYGWNNNGQDNWREVRFLYNYSDQELEEWQNRIDLLKQKVKQMTILFNNNSGGHAYENAKRFQRMSNLTYEGLNPKQIDLFTD
ncbi:DUF72 domain-containing protein [Alkalibacillus haloalkaliphilus]|uniref:DUF72 domain-containing protein n=1 Tax=Alkalibacillus haloalkaliphilus TaxID=94136 RepID=UPI00031A96C3|nr:DUF72 domain-containing protein [Alkalibacillus haloalkaliphilus]